MFVRAAARYLGFSLGAGETGAGSTRVGAPDAPGSGTVESAARHTPLDDATTGERTGRWRRTVVRSVCALVVAGAVFGAYHVGRSQGIEQAQDETGGFIRPTPTGPTEPAVVADLLSRYGLMCDETLRVHERSDWMRHAYVCPVASQWFELDIHHQGWQVFRTLDLVGHGMACIPLDGTRPLNWWTVHRDDWLVILHDPVVAGRLASIPGATISRGQCARSVTGHAA